MILRTLAVLSAISGAGPMPCRPDAGDLQLELTPTGEPPEWIHLMPYGTWRGYRKGEELRAFELGPDDALAALEHFERRGLDLVVDYEHQSIWAPVTGKAAPAAGWVDRMEIRADGLWGHVRWNAPAAAHIRAREYRYLSPVLSFHHIDERSGADAGTVLPSVALTNTPFLDAALHAVAARSSHGAPLMRKIFALCLALLGISASPEDATEDQVKSAITDLTTRFDAACKALGLTTTAKLEDITAAASGAQDRLTAACKALGLEAGAALADIEAAALRLTGQAELGALACGSLQLDPAKLTDADRARLKLELAHSGYVTVAEHAAALAQLGGQVEQLTDDQILAKARQDGKLTPALEGWAKGHIKRDRPGFEAWLKNAPGIPLGSPQHRPPADGGPTTLSEAEQAICSQLGLTPETYLKTKKEA